MELTPGERRALDQIARDLDADRRLRRSMRAIHPPATRGRRVAVALVLAAVVVAGPSVALLGVGQELVAVVALAVVLGTVALLLWLARSG